MSGFIFIGAPGSGKGTISNQLKTQGYQHISTGDLLREEVKKGTDLGKRINDIISKGNLVNDQMALELIANNLDQTKDFILDGFPRTSVQAQMLDDLLKVKTQVVLFNIDQVKLTERLVNRRSCEKCGAIFNLKTSAPKVQNTCDNCKHTPLTHRKDDTLEVVENRFNVFNNTKTNLLSYYGNRIKVINADQDVQSVLQEVIKLK